MAQDSLGRISVCVLDSGGLLQVRTEQGQFPGLLEEVPAALSVGDEVRFLLQGPPAVGDVEVAGEILVLENGPGPVALCDGLVFELEQPALGDATMADQPPSPAPVDLGEDATRVEVATIEAVSAEEPVLHEQHQAAALVVSDDEAAEVDDDATVRGRRLRTVEPEHEDDVVEATEPSGIVGTLREMDLSEVVQSLELSGKTAEVAMRPKGGTPGVVFLASGRVVYARCGELLGEEAFFAMAQHRRGRFLIRFHSEEPAGRNIDKPTSYLMLESMRRMDEERHGHEEAAAAPAMDLEAADIGATAPHGRRATGLTAELFGDEAPEATEAAAVEEYDLDASAEHAIVAVEEVEDAPTAAPAPTRARSTDVFFRFFEEASEEGLIAKVRALPADDVPEPTFATLKAALRGLRASDDDSFAVPHRPVQTTGEFRA